MYIVRRCKNKPGISDDCYNRVHIADDNNTYCGKELNEMWYIESDHAYSSEDVTCPECLSKMRGNI